MCDDSIARMMFSLTPLRFRSMRRSRYIQSTDSSASGSIVAGVSSWLGDSMISSLAPRGVIMSNMPMPSRTTSHSMRKYASASGTTRPSGTGSIHVTSGSVLRFSATGSRAGPRSIGRARRSRPFSMSMQTLVAMR